VEIKQDDELKHIPVVIWTTSSMEEDICLCREAGAEGFVTKPASFEELVSAVGAIVRKWLPL
jgi:CheY-like chemotaxis protein